MTGQTKQVLQNRGKASIYTYYDMKKLGSVRIALPLFPSHDTAA